MATLRIVAACGAGLFVTAAGYMLAKPQDPSHDTPVEVVSTDTSAELPVSDPSCTFFGPNRDKFNGSRRLIEKARLTAAVADQLPVASDVMAAFAANAASAMLGARRQPNRYIAAHRQ
jgi:hypothetical protein